MLLFRSEEHIERWCGQRSAERGGTMTPATMMALASAWYSDRLSPAWRRKTMEEAHAVFESLGLTGQFWRLG